MGVQLSGVKILTMQWMEGCKITDLEALRAAKLRPRDVGNVLLDAFARMQYVEGWVHGDAHSGNLLVRPAQHQREAPAQPTLTSALRQTPHIELIVRAV